MNLHFPLSSPTHSQTPPPPTWFGSTSHFSTDGTAATLQNPWVYVSTSVETVFLPQRAWDACEPRHTLVHAHTKRNGKRVLEMESKCSFPFLEWASYRQVPLIFFIIVFIGIIPDGNFFQERFVWYLKVELALHSGEKSKSKSKSSLCYNAACFSLERCWRQKCTIACLSIFHLQEHLFIDLCLYILNVCGVNLFFEI